MKRIFILSAMLATFSMSMAQEVKTYSVYDNNQSNDLDIADITGAVEQVKKNVAASSTQQYVTAEDLSTLLQQINTKLEKLTDIEARLAAIEAKVGGASEEPNVDNNGHDYVDLGLTDADGKPVYWATCNVGANSPEGYGDYFAWGETKAYGEEDTSNTHNYQTQGTYTKTYYDWSTYKYSDGTSGYSITKYNFADQKLHSNWYKDGKFIGDNKTVLDPEDDAATVNWGGAWRMPTEAEQAELLTKCTWTWTTLNNVNGYNVVGPNGNSIFLPAAGYRNESSLGSLGSYVYYWSSTLNSYSSFLGCCFNFSSNYIGADDSDRYFGRSVRAVCQ